MQSGIFEAERLRIVINQTEYVDNTKIEQKAIGRRRKTIEITITASIGLATYPFDRPIKNEIDFFALAKKALDRAKTTGKNKTISASDLKIEK
jgi:GGDEF domain-containing protein